MFILMTRFFDAPLSFMPEPRALLTLGLTHLAGSRPVALLLQVLARTSG